MSNETSGTAGRCVLPGQSVLVLQGGGALGAYQVGVYQALHEAGIELDWVIGTSIGAINGAIIAGNPVEARLDRFDEFWSSVVQKPFGFDLPFLPAFGNAASNFATLAGGISGFFSPNPAALWGLHAAVGVEKAGFYSTAELRQTLHDSLDADLLSTGKPRLTVGAVNVRTGVMRYFDSREGALGIEHILASSALPPAFPAVRIKGEPYWDGGIYSNTPLEAVFDDEPRRDSVVFSAQMWDPIGPEPETIWQVLGRHKEIQYASRVKSHIERQEQIHCLRHVVRELTKAMPQERQSDPHVQELAAYGCGTTMHIVRLVSPRLDGEDHLRDIDFSASGIRARREAGYADTQRMIARAPWEQAVDPLSGVAIHELP